MDQKNMLNKGNKYELNIQTKTKKGNNFSRDEHISMIP